MSRITIVGSSWAADGVATASRPARVFIRRSRSRPPSVGREGKISRGQVSLLGLVDGP